jgi:hypothetical protein
MQGDWSFPSAHPRYSRMVLRPGGAATVEQADTAAADFPRIDPRRTGLRHRALFALTGSGDGGWPLSRIDRIVLWMALAEMRYFKDIPYKVSIDEAIELAKQFSEANASNFINGILDTLSKEYLVNTEQSNG